MTSGAIRLVIDDRAARYPLHVDPVIVTESFIAKGHGQVRFGQVVAISGDTAVVGSPGDDQVAAAVG